MDETSTPLENLEQNSQAIFDFFVMMPNAFFDNLAFSPSGNSIMAIKKFAREFELND